jgi:RNA polymerase sigma factor (sigma-70 family)
MTDSNVLPPKNDQQIFSAQDYQLIYGVLRQLNISPSRNDYQDLLQEAALVLLQARRKNAQAATQREFKAGYYFQLVKWRLLDILRHQQRHKLPAFSLEKAQEKTDDANPFEIADPHANRQTDDLLTGELAKQLWQRCTAHEQLYLSYRLQDYTITEIAQKCGVSRQTIYNWRAGLFKKIVELDDRLAGK